MKKKRKILVLIVIFVIILLILINIAQRKNANNITVSDSTDQTIDSSVQELEELKQMNEKQRIKFYFSKYIENLENGNFEVAYNMLYEEFKNNYFSTLEKYEEYIKEKYPEIITVSYVNFQREGIYYILTMEIQDLINDTSFEQIFVVREYDYNNFVLSFQAE